MGLADAARQAQEKAVSRELLFLRECRAYVKKATNELINKQNLRIIQLENEGTEDAWRQANRIRGDILEVAARRTLYEGILEQAEKAERAEKGGAEKLVKEKMKDWQDCLDVIRKECQEIREFQLTLEGV